MGIYYHYANFTKRERLAVDALGGSPRFSAAGRTLAARAFHLLMFDRTPGAPGDDPKHWQGRWARDSVAIVGDDLLPDFEKFKAEFADIGANAILLVHSADGFEEIAEAAHKSKSLFMELCYLVSTRQALELEPHMKQEFGGRYLQRFKELCREDRLFTPVDLITAARA
jgi:hypothetical protein